MHRKRTWGPCEGGNHATENCFANQQGCHPISALPFASVDLTTGIGNFGSGGGSYMLDCPGNVMPCPVPDASGHVQVIVSGEYTVTYTDSNGMTCQYPLYVGAKGLRVELSWNYPVSGGTTDLDLHMHEPGTTTPWSIEGATEDCGYGNCKIESEFPPFGDPSVAPNWFPATQAMPGDPVSWFLDPVMTNNTCYYAPRNEGQAWIDNGQGCHNPRLDIDDISCDPSITDVTNYDFCAPENINIDFPPQNQWIRVGVNYYPYTSSYAGAIHPDVKIYCDGALVGELGQHGFYSPEAPITWDSNDYSTFWPVADVMFKKDQCTSTCIVQPIYADPAAKTPLFEPNQTPGSSPPFGPAYPPNP